eukprot:1697214-Pleurochrysis_carterae.AAC.1
MMASSTPQVATPCGMLRLACATRAMPRPRAYAPSVALRYALATRAWAAGCDEATMMIAMIV